MSSKKEEKGQGATDRLKAAALSATKGLSRTQAEKAAAAATRNVNAYGQKEEGPSRWQERKEMKRQMYLMSTEKQVRLGERKDTKANVSSIGAGVASQCQKCFKPGHWTYECKNERVYISRPSRSQLLKNPKLRQKMMPSSYTEDNPDIVKGEEEEKAEDKKDEKVKKRRKKSKSKRKYKSDTESSRSEGSESESDSRSLSASGSDSGGSSYSSSSSDSEEEIRGRKSKKDKRTQKKGRRKSKSKRYSSSSASESSSESKSESESEPESEGGKRRKSRKHSRRS